MIVSALALCLIAAPDVTLVWRSGESSRDASSSQTTWTLDGPALTRATKHSGRAAMPPNKDKTTTATVPADELKKLAECYADIEAAAKKYTPAKEKRREGLYTEVHYVRGSQVVDLYFPYRVDDVDSAPKDEPKAKRDLLDAIDTLRGKLVNIEG